MLWAACMPLPSVSVNGQLTLRAYYKPLRPIEATNKFTQKATSFSNNFLGVQTRQTPMHKSNVYGITTWAARVALRSVQQEIPQHDTTKV